MTITADDYNRLHKLMETSSENRELLQKFIDHHNYTLSKLSHEIRNSLALISSSLQLIEAQHPETRDFRHWESVTADITFLTNLLIELSDYNNGERLHPATFDSRDFLGQICLSFAASCADSGIDFASRLPDTLPPVTGDRTKLQEVFINLLQNARDAVAPVGRIRLHASADTHFLTVAVSDDGCGIPAEQLAEIFDLFVTHKSNGTGMGLAIAQRIVKAHNGKITVDSAPGNGACFTVVLPIV